MGSRKNDILQGTLVLLILKTLASSKRMHGYAITSHIRRISDHLLRVEEGSLYPALHRLEQEGLVRAEWGKTEKNREARFYSLTAKGRKQLTEEEASWSRLTEGVARVIRSCRGLNDAGTFFDPDACKRT
jgi:PadR family transcriptional regulator, regulatory protein PadR